MIKPQPLESFLLRKKVGDMVDYVDAWQSTGYGSACELAAPVLSVVAENSSPMKQQIRNRKSFMVTQSVDTNRSRKISNFSS